MSAQISYTLSHKVRQVDTAFDLLLKGTPDFLSYFSLAQKELINNTKYEWFDDQLAPTSTDITSFGTDGDGTVFNVTSTAGFVVGSVVRFTSTLGATYTEYAQVSAINSATQLTIVRDYASTTGITLLVGDIIHLVSSPKLEGSTVGSGLFHEATAAYNYTEIFDEVAEVTGTTEVTNTYDGSAKIAKQELIAMQRLKYKLENAIIHGLPVQRTDTVQGTMGGLRYYLSQAGGNIVAAGSNPISATYLDNALDLMFGNGAPNMNYVILCNSNQSRKITALNTAGSNPVITKNYNPNQRMGSYVTEFVGDIAMKNGSYTGRVFSCLNMPKDQIMILDMSRISLKVMRRLISMDASAPGEDSKRTRLLTELTLEVKNAKQAHAIITGLTL